MRISLADYFGRYANDPDATPEVYAAAERLLTQVDMLLNVMVADGCTLLVNPATKSYVSGSGNGGFRPQSCPIGAPKSKHKTGHGIDIYDPYRELAKWCYRNQDKLEALGLGIEDARWTGSANGFGWLHLQDVPPGPLGSPWRFSFIPNNDPPTDPNFKA